MEYTVPDPAQHWRRLAVVYANSAVKQQIWLTMAASDINQTGPGVVLTRPISYSHYYLGF